MPAFRPLGEIFPDWDLQVVCEQGPKGLFGVCSVGLPFHKKYVVTTIELRESYQYNEGVFFRKDEVTGMWC